MQREATECAAANASKSTLIFTIAKKKSCIMARNAHFKSHFSRLLIVFGAAACFVVCNSKVTERTRYYPCCNPNIGFDKGCEHTWKFNETTFAYFNKHSNACIPPCKRIEDGVMILNECAAITEKKVHTDGMTVTREEWIHFFPERCPNSAPGRGNQVAGFVILMLLISMNVFIKL